MNPRDPSEEPMEEEGLALPPNVSYSLYPLKEGFMRCSTEVITSDTRSLDSSSYHHIYSGPIQVLNWGPK